jgi:hypothetical protein
MENYTLEENLSFVIEALYQGINKVADKVRDGESPEEELRYMAADFCKRWPTCFQAHMQDK